MNFQPTDIICSEITDEIMGDVLEKIVQEDCEAENKKNKDEDNSVENMVEMMETCDPFNDSNTQIIMCTEITEDEVKDIDSNASRETSDQNLISWFDLFKKAYASWGRAEQDNSGNPDEPTTAAENNAMEDELEEIFSDTECAAQLKPKMMVFHRAPLEVEDDSEVDTVKDDKETSTSAAVLKSFVGYKNIDQQSEEDTEKLCEAEMDVNGNLSENENYMVETLSDIEKDQYKQESETEEDDNEKLFEMKMNEDPKDSGVEFIEYQEISELFESKREDNREPTAGTKKVNSRVRRSARLASQLFSNLGSVVKTEEAEGVKLVRRRSARLEGARKRKAKDEGDEADKRGKNE